MLLFHLNLKQTNKTLKGHLHLLSKSFFFFQVRLFPKYNSAPAACFLEKKKTLFSLIRSQLHVVFKRSYETLSFPFFFFPLFSCSFSCQVPLLQKDVWGRKELQNRDRSSNIILT